MGTNYYTKPILPAIVKDKILKFLDDGLFDEARDLIPCRAHIGKQSDGWQFCFNHNDWSFFDKNVDSMKDWLLNSVIVSEYGDIISFTKFWEMVEANKDKLDNNKYFSRMVSTYIPQNYGQETHFGLFFSDSTEFS